jgi:hypothetical protein
VGGCPTTARGAMAARARPRKVTTPGGPVWAKSVERSRPVAKIAKVNRDGLPWPLGRIGELNKRAYRNCF